jgi:hypothetical protein
MVAPGMPVPVMVVSSELTGWSVGAVEAVADNAAFVTVVVAWADPLPDGSLWVAVTMVVVARGRTGVSVQL